jgi:hypothetical protein
MSALLKRDTGETAPILPIVSARRSHDSDFFVARGALESGRRCPLPEHVDELGLQGGGSRLPCVRIGAALRFSPEAMRRFVVGLQGTNVHPLRTID